MKSSSRWKFLWQQNGGHKFFADLDGPPGTVAVADDSGDYPDETEDGILFLDRTKPIAMQPRGCAMVPLLTPDGESKSMISEKHEAHRISHEFGMKLTA